jgi:hypothetical protein
MNWLERARREMRGDGRMVTANTAEGDPTAATAVSDDALLHEYEERAAIMEFDGGLSREAAERAAWALAFKDRRLH